MKKEQLTLETQASALTKKQSGWILTTKLTPPLIRSDIIDRPQLLAWLERAIPRPLTLIAAPAGYGKSTLVAQWLQASSLPGVWISLDEGDSNLRSFLSYIVAAVRRLVADACASINDLLDVTQLPPSNILAQLLVNDLEEIDQPFLLVLDDYHLITDPDIHDLLNRLLQHPPRSLLLVIVTRCDPPFPLITMKSKGLAVEIRESDLQFDTQETAQLLAKAGDIHLDKDGLSRLMEKIEGWVTGLRLFCLAVDKGKDLKACLMGVGSSSDNVQDYLVAQVLSRQVLEIQQCLVKTSILDRFCAPLCEALCKTEASETYSGMTGQKFMATIVDTKLFGVQLEQDGTWIRYHHLFQELLQSQLLKQSSPQDIATLHQRAAQWFSEQGLIEEAIKHALAAANHELAADIIEDARFEMLKMDKGHRLFKLLDSLPPEIEQSRPHLLMIRAYVFLHSFRFAEIPALLDQMVALEGESPSDPMLAGELHFFRGYNELYMGEIESSQRHLNAALCEIPDSNLEGRCLSEMYACIARHMAGLHDESVNGLQTAIQRNEARSPFYLSRLVFGLSYVHSLAGHWPESARAAKHMLSVSLSNDLVYAATWGFYLQGNALLQMVDLEKVERCFAQVFKWRYVASPRAVTDCLVGYALSQQLQGKAMETEQCLQQVREFAQWTGNSTLIEVAGSARARICLLRGDLDAAARWLAAYHGKPDVPVKVFFLEYPEITACRVLVAKGTTESLNQASTRLTRLEKESRRFHQDCQLLPILVQKSILALKQDCLPHALALLTEAVGLAWSGRCMLPFLEGGAPVAEMLRQLPENPEWGGFVSEVQSRCSLPGGQEEVQQATSGEKNILIEVLTIREMDVLKLLCEHLYDKEIAERLSISPFTVKTHLSHIYNKLGVSGRRQAVQKARQLALL